ncbi:MAG TPA: response regulator transcription factor [Tahibacter sp.]|jgi:DNA-binding response OmpR family regulator|nr:response regulator transcription factor [Tahibacter sp.]
MRILLVEDELEMAGALSAALLRHDMVVDHVTTIAHAMQATRGELHDAIVLDRHLPGGDGLALLATWRANGLSTPVIVLSASGELDDRLSGLDGGADDYLAKPFAVEELVARLRAVLRRPAALQAEVLKVGTLHFESAHREARVGATPLDLPRRELLVLEALMRRRGRTVLRDALEEAVYGFDDAIQSNALDTHVSRLRRKLDEAGCDVEIHTIRGVGYLLRQRP